MNLSCGVVLIDVERGNLIECNVPGSTISQCESGRECVFSEDEHLSTQFHCIIHIEHYLYGGKVLCG